MFDKNTKRVGAIQVCSGRRNVTLKSYSIVAYPAHNILLKFSDQFDPLLIDDGHMLLALIPVSTSVPRLANEIGEPKPRKVLNLNENDIPNSHNLTPSTTRKARTPSVKALHN